MTVVEIKEIIADASIVGLADLVEEAVRRWAGTDDAHINMYGDIFVEGNRLSDEKVLEFFSWNEIN